MKWNKGEHGDYYTDCGRFRVRKTLSRRHRADGFYWAVQRRAPVAIGSSVMCWRTECLTRTLGAGKRTVEEVESKR